MVLIRIFLLSKIGNAFDRQTPEGGVKVFVALEPGGQAVDGIADFDFAEDDGGFCAVLYGGDFALHRKPFQHTESFHYLEFTVALSGRITLAPSMLNTCCGIISLLAASFCEAFSFF